MKRPLLGIFCAFSLGILIENFIDIPVFHTFACALIFLLFSLLFIKSRTKFLLSVFLGFLFLGGFAFKNYTSVPKNHIKNIVYVAPSTRRKIVVQGEILDKPTQKKIIYYNKSESEFLLKVKTVRVDKDWKRSCGILLVNAFNPTVNFKYADEVILEGYLAVPRPATNPGQFDYKKFLERKKIFYILNVKKGDFSKINGRSPQNPVRLIAYKASERIESLINRFMPEQEGSVLNAILLGNRRGIDADTNEDFVKTGTVHILAISGLHVGLLASLFILLFKLLRIPFRIWAAPLALLLVFYSIMVGSRPPVTRATIMILVFLFGRILKREQDLLNSLVFSALVILFLNPQDLFDVGFQLSFLTVGAIIYFTPRLEEKRIGNERGLQFKQYLLRAVLVSFSAWLGSAPFIARYFNIFSPITIIANLFVVPWMFFVLATSLTFILFGFLSSALGLIFSQVSSLSILILLKMASLFSKIPGSYFRVKSPPWILIIGFYIFLLLFFNRRHVRIRARYFLITALVILNICVWRAAFFEGPRLLKIGFLDVGKGDAIVLEFPRGGVMLIDGGEGLGVDMGRAVVGRFLGSEGINNIDMVVSTHPHTDHVGGLVWVLKNFKVKYFVENGEAEQNPLYLECQELIKQKGVKRFIVKGGDSIKGFDGVEINVLNPPTKRFSEPNDNSLVLKLRYRDSSVLFCGDVKEEAARDLLLRENERLASKVLKVPHHGGILGEEISEFLEKINPKIAVISVRNKKINKNLSEIFNRLHTKVYRTDINGAVFLTTDGKKDIIEGYKK